MPKDEFDFDDPMELNGVGIVSAEDTTEAMTECFVEEFMRLGYNHKQIMAMFRNPHYIGMNMALQNRGEPFVRDKIGEVFARWGKAVAWASPGGTCVSPDHVPQNIVELANTSETVVKPEPCSVPTDPMGEPVPDLNL